jgi:hypothetical protein
MGILRARTGCAAELAGCFLAGRQAVAGRRGRPHMHDDRVVFGGAAVPDPAAYGNYCVRDSTVMYMPVISGELVLGTQL